MLFVILTSGVLVLWLILLIASHDHNWLSRHQHSIHLQRRVWPHHPHHWEDEDIDRQDSPNDDDHHLLQRGGIRKSHPQYLTHNSTDYKEEEFQEDNDNDDNKDNKEDDDEIDIEPIVTTKSHNNGLNTRPQDDKRKIKDIQQKLLSFMKHPPKSSKIITPYEGEVNIYDLTKPIRGHFDCLRLKMRPDPMICLYPDSKDKIISYGIRHHGIWEPDISAMFVHLLHADPHLGVIDIGANIGVYTMIAASMNRPVLAVEPYIGHAHHMHKAISIGGFEDRVTLVTDGISDARKNRVHLHTADPDNLGSLALKDGCPQNAEKKGTCFSSILMDDIAEIAVTRFPKKKVILKIDIEGHEPSALLHSTRLFDSVYIAAVLMEWHQLRSTFVGPEHVSPQKSAVLKIIWILSSRGYSGFTYYDGGKQLKSLSLHEWYGWPEDVVWKHEHADL